MGNDPILDMDTIATLREIEEASEENANFFSELVAMFMTNSKEHLLNMKQCAETNNGEELVKHAHKLKGESANIGAMRLAGICQEIQEKDSDDVISQIKPIWTELVKAYKTTLAEYDKLLKG